MNKLHIEWRTLCIAIMVAIVVGCSTFWLSGLGFWVPFTLTLTVLLMNDVHAGWEDGQPGLNNPPPPKINDPDKK